MDRYILQSARATGKSTKLVQLSAKTQIPIMVRFVDDIKGYEFLAKELGLDIPKPVRGTLELSTPLNARSKGVLIDDLSRHLPNEVKGFTNSIESYDHLDWSYYSIEDPIEKPIKNLVVFGKYLIRASFTEGIPYFFPSHIYYTQIRAKGVKYYEITAITRGAFYYQDFDRIGRSSCVLIVNIATLQTEKEVLEWYLSINAGGTVHSEYELTRVQNMIKELGDK